MLLLFPGRWRRWQGVRRLQREECDMVEYEGPLSLHRMETRFLIGLWRPTNQYAVRHTQRGTVWSGSRKELEALGITT